MYMENNTTPITSTLVTKYDPTRGVCNPTTTVPCAPIYTVTPTNTGYTVTMVPVFDSNHTHTTYPTIGEMELGCAVHLTQYLQTTFEDWFGDLLGEVYGDDGGTPTPQIARENHKELGWFLNPAQPWYPQG